MSGLKDNVSEEALFLELSLLVFQQATSSSFDKSSFTLKFILCGALDIVCRVDIRVLGIIILCLIFS